jgi:hypothetical protein
MTGMTGLAVAAAMVLGVAVAPPATAATPAAAPFVVRPQFSTAQSPSSYFLGIWYLTNNTSTTIPVTRKDFQLKFTRGDGPTGWQSCIIFGVYEPYGHSQVMKVLSGHPGPTAYLHIPPETTVEIGCLFNAYEPTQPQIAFEVRYDIDGYRGIEKGTV